MRATRNCSNTSCIFMLAVMVIGLGVITRTKGALSRPESSFHSSVIETACNACGICVDRCPVDAITVNGVATVDTARCIGCGLCEKECVIVGDKRGVYVSAEGETRSHGYNDRDRSIRLIKSQE